MVMLVCFCLGGCAASAPRPPVELPFAVHQEGATVSTELRIPNKLSFAFIPAFPWIAILGPPHTYSFRLVFPVKDYEESKSVRKLVGRGTMNIFTGNLAEPGIPIQVKLTIRVIETAGEKTLVEKEVTTMGLDAWNEKRLKRGMGRFKLPPGLYRVTLENLKGKPEFANIGVLFGIYEARIY